MAWLRKTRNLPGGAPGGLIWATERDVVEVDDVLAAELLEIKDAGFVSVAAPQPGPQEEPDAAAHEGEQPPAKAPAKKTAASKSAASKTAVAE